MHGEASTQHSALSTRRRLLLHLAALLLLAAVAHFAFFFFRDNFATHYPVKTISAAMLRSGGIPWWNPYDGGGQPIAGNPNFLTFYPTTLLYVVLPSHVAFNLHFLLHLIGGWLAMRALTHSRWAASVYVLSGVVISATALYNLIAYVFLIPLALLGIDRRSWRYLGIAFGWMLLAAEPVTMLGAGIVVAIAAWRRISPRSILIAIVLALAIASPQLIAYSEIAGEVERSIGVSSQTVLNTSLTPARVAEIFVWPFSGFLNDAGGNRGRLFSTLFIGLIAIPALFTRSRYVVAALILLALAIGRFNPLVKLAVEQIEALRIMRFPEKFALPLTVVLIVLIARYFEKTRFKLLWSIATFVPLIVFAIRALPIDWFSPYDVQPGKPRRVHVTRTLPAGKLPARAEYRLRARNLEPLFGSLGGLHYVLRRSPDRMHSLRSRIVLERARTEPQPWRTIALGPDIRAISGEVVPEGPFAFSTKGPAVVMVNQSYFKAWRATMNGRELETMPLFIDRLGVKVPEAGRVTVSFGRKRVLIGAAWALSLLLLLIKERDRRPREIERPADEH